MDYKKIQPIIEAYTCIQTEGSKAGKPHFLIRTTGCTHRCWFGHGGWCDSWYSSITPEKGSFSLEQIEALFLSRKDITHLMISGGSPTMHPKLVNELVSIFKSIHFCGFVTLETEGSHFIETTHKIDLISLSPKFMNSIPIKGIPLPNSEKLVDEKMIDQHNKFRMNIEVMKKMLEYHKDYHLKPVIDRNDQSVWLELQILQQHLNIPNNKVWLMPAGDTLDKLQPNYPYVMEQAIERGYNFTGRAHIVAYGDKRGV